MGDNKKLLSNKNKTEKNENENFYNFGQLEIEMVKINIFYLPHYFTIWIIRVK